MPTYLTVTIRRLVLVIEQHINNIITMFTVYL